ncbi:MAG: YceI family protein [Armatimonadota bacterium]|nr:YceI family protein [Armatimonadota bacterium]
MGRVTVVLCAIALVGTTAGSPVRGAAPTPAALLRFVIVPAESSVTYRVAEVFLNEGNRLNIAVGVTSAVRGEILVDRARPANSRIGVITVDISQFRSDSARRDNAIRTRWLESARFPLAEFTPTSIQGLPETYQDGRELSLQVVGNLKVRDVTRPTTFAVTLKLDGETLTGTATTTIRMTDFGFDPPSILGILRAENEARLEFRFTARPASGTS